MKILWYDSKLLIIFHMKQINMRTFKNGYILNNGNHIIEQVAKHFIQQFLFMVIRF
jgi:hypothetical protein